MSITAESGDDGGRLELATEVLLACLCLATALVNHSLLERRWRQARSLIMLGPLATCRWCTWWPTGRRKEGCKQHIRRQAEVDDFLCERPPMLSGTCTGRGGFARQCVSETVLIIPVGGWSSEAMARASTWVGAARPGCPVFLSAT
jgi:hypothetical protein